MKKETIKGDKINAKIVGAGPMSVQGITLIALIISVIILLILSGVVINLTVGERGIFKTAQNAGKNYKEAQNNELLGINYIDTQINQNVVNIKITSFEQMLSNNGINNTYTKLDFANNKDDILNKILKDNSSIDYIISNPIEYIDLLTKSQIAMECIGNSKEMGDKAIDNETWREAILASQYLSDFNKSAKKVPIMTNHTQPEGEAFVSKTEGDYIGTMAWRAFDGDDATGGYIAKGYTKDGYIGYKFEEKVKAYYVEILNGDNGYGSYLSMIKVQGSNDGINYVDLTEEINIPRSGWSNLKLTNETAYEKYQYLRILQTEDKGSLYAGAFTIQFYGR